MKPRILVVDAHDAGREELAGLLSDRGYRVVTAKGPEEMLDLAVVTAPEVVMVDDGFLHGHWQMLSHIRHRLPSALILVLLTYGDAGQLELASRAGANGFVLKSACSAELVTVIEGKLSEVGRKGGVEGSNQSSPLGQPLDREERR